MSSDPDNAGRVWDDGAARWVDDPWAARKRGVKPLRAMDLAALADMEPQPVGFAVKGLLPEGETTLLTAPGGGNKTTLALMLAVSMAARLDQCLGLDVRSCPAAYLGMEDSEGRLHWLLHHICAGLGVRLGDLAGRLSVVSMRQEASNGLAHFDHEGGLEPDDLYFRAARLIEDSGAGLLVLDNLAHLFLGNENDRGQATRFLALLNRLADETGAAILLLAHTPKNGENFSGSTAWINAVRSHASIEKEEGGDPEIRVLKVSKGNYVRPGEVSRFRWFNHYLVRPEDLPPRVAEQLAATSRASSANDAFLRCLAKVGEQGRAVSHSKGANYAPRIFARMPEAKGFELADFEAAMERLLHKGDLLADQEVGKYANRTARRGLKHVGEGAQKGAQSPAQEGAQEGAQDAQSERETEDDLHNPSAHSAPSPTERDGTHKVPSPSAGDAEADWMPGDD